ncbi:CoA-binding protein [Halolactibacillus alkaliphilus]|uniref:CoA-binding protein n=1 Tax=Halolactibacillus alkaliphilus TaxID=442899 RepID=A0A511WZY2_9BACI|nr:CoA-binding protein [Halolactibacillus alkaliphilus]GEN56257.1 CoA-binding protein [Halolactibacillus alkaliphilus]GGN66319.1 CoA-binding protein [Halolactibacillus alkaliphilus]SFO67490.1 Predicted CoA-binding protein [Halolactibacillus alkaliphilus]
MYTEQTSNQTFQHILTEAKTIAVVGLSNKPNRTSYQVSLKMQQLGYKIIPVNPTIKEALGEKSVATLSDINEPVDIVNVFRKAMFLDDIVKAAINIDAPVVWAQLGIYDEAVFKRYHQDVKLIMDTCIKVKYYEVMS